MWSRFISCSLKLDELAFLTAQNRRCTREKPSVLAIGMSPEEIGALERCLAGLVQEVVGVSTAQEVLGSLRRILPTQAIVPIEMALHGQSMIARLSALPSMRCLVAIGRGEDHRAEALARSAGADVYLARPVPAEMLALAMNLGAQKSPLLWTSGCPPRAAPG